MQGVEELLVQRAQRGILLSGLELSHLSRLRFMLSQCFVALAVFGAVACSVDGEGANSEQQLDGGETPSRDHRDAALGADAMVDAERRVDGAAEDAGDSGDDLVDGGSSDAAEPNSADAAEPDLPTDCDDYDDDGICDAIDPCPVDKPNNPDGDGVCSSVDPCPNDFRDDHDGDGSCDSDDPCPDDPMDDTDGDGSCDSDDDCPLDNPNDTDGDGTCDSNDTCPLDAAGDSDGDGSCDSDDLCPGFDDELDSDHDGVPDGCDRCPASDDDGDLNGYPDACDQVLWTMAISQRQLSVSDGLLPVTNPKSVLLLHRGDDAYLSVAVPISASLQTRSVPDSTATFEIEVGGVTTPSTLTAAFDAIRTDSSGTNTEGRILLEWDAASSWFADGWSQSPVQSSATIRRFVVIGYATPDALVQMEWQVRGY